MSEQLVLGCQFPWNRDGVSCEVQCEFRYHCRSAPFQHPPTRPMGQATHPRVRLEPRKGLSILLFLSGTASTGVC
jgi:hypothetical protein